MLNDDIKKKTFTLRTENDEEMKLNAEELALLIDLRLSDEETRQKIIDKLKSEIAQKSSSDQNSVDM